MLISALISVHLPINKNTAKSPSQSCHREPNSEASKKAQICAQSSKFSATTWKEKHYGMILKLQNSDTLQAEAACNVPESLPKPTGANSVFYCTLKHEVVGYKQAKMRFIVDFMSLSSPPLYI